VIITKLDLLPYVPFDLTKARENCLRVHPDVEIVEVAATKDAGLDQWMNWLRKRKETTLKGRRAVLVN
jgi:hydrogenase nickel incorporation protein HypB